jgi:hypothetical protein
MFGRQNRINKPAAIMAVPSVFLLLVSIFGFSAQVQATFTTNTQISGGQGFLQGEFAEVGVRANGAFGSAGVPSGFHQNPASCLGFRVDREMDGWGTTTDDGDYFCPGSPFEGWQVKVGSSLGQNDHGQTGVSGAVSDVQNSGSSQCVSWNSASPYNGVSISQRYCVPTAGQALHTDVTLTNTTGSAVSDIYFGRGFDPDNATGNGDMTCGGSTTTTGMFYSCNAVTGQGTEAQATSRWGNGSFIALQSFDARARVARQTGGFSSPDPTDIWNAGNTLATSGTYLGNVGELGADAGLYVALQIPTLGAGASTSFRISYVLSADGNNAPVLGAPVVSGIGQTSATVASTVNPKGFSTTAELVYSTDPDFGTSSTVSMGTFTGSDELAIDAEITGLDPSEIYYAKIVATNETGETESAVFEFETLAATAPIVSSEEPTVTVDDGPVTLSGTLNPNGFSSTAVFQYSTTADFSGTVVDIPVSGTFTGTSLSTVSTVVSGLTGSTTYYFRLKVTNASGSAYGSTLSFVPADIPAPTSLVVTSLEDTTADGTLRWAITQANSTAGGIYDAIDINTEGTITLTSDLPAITAGVTITGTGMATTIIDGNNLYRAIYNSGSRTIVIEDMTFKQGKNVSWNGGLIYNSNGTMTFNRIKISDHSSWAFYQHNGGVTTFNNSQFVNNGYAITSDHGGTPSALSLTDTNYSNRIYINDSTFTSNTYGIRTERFVKINNSQFVENMQAGAYLGGLNRQQVTNSVFTSNGTGVYLSSWIPTSWAVGAGNQTVSGNAFNGNTTAIEFANRWNNGATIHNGVSANSFSTASGNTFGATAANTNNFSGSGYAESENTITPVTTTTTTSTTTTSTSTTTTTEAPTESTEPEVVVVPVSPEPETTVPEDTTPATEETLPEETETEETLPDTTDETVPSETETGTESGPSEESTPEPGEVALIVDSLPDDATAEEVADAVFEAIDGAAAEEVGAILQSVFEDATSEEVVAILSAVFDDASSEEIVSILSETFADGATDEEVAAVTEALLSDGITAEAVSTLIDVLDSGVIDESQVQDVVDAILVEELNEEVATELATSAAVIQNITAEQATDIFESVPVGELSTEEGTEIVDAVQDAPTEVKESFEEEINVFAGVFDDYVALGSTIDVGTRRSVIAVNLVTSTVALAAAAGGIPTPGSGSGPSGPSGPKQDVATRKEEEESEEGGAIEGEGPDWIKRISIYKYEDGVRVMDWKNFTRKFVYGIMASGFTLAGATVMYFTLSGLTQQIALWGTVLAFTGSMYLHMKEPDSE